MRQTQSSLRHGALIRGPRAFAVSQRCRLSGVFAQETCKPSTARRRERGMKRKPQGETCAALAAFKRNIAAMGAHQGVDDPQAHAGAAFGAAGGEEWLEE